MVNRLLNYQLDGTDLEATTSAILDDLDTFIIERIVGHEIVGETSKRTLNLNIKWHGYKDTEWSSLNISLKKNGAVQDYLKANSLEQFGLKTVPNANGKDELPKKRVRFSSSVPEATAM